MISVLIDLLIKNGYTVDYVSKKKPIFEKRERLDYTRKINFISKFEYYINYDQIRDVHFRVFL